MLRAKVITRVLPEALMEEIAMLVPPLVTVNVVGSKYVELMFFTSV